ncbi:MAG: DUF3108 domain-containing protein [Bacteroidetes bacterium]|nr:DUF3108 domain-containing protein [Bacteroidota bacterium]
MKKLFGYWNLRFALSIVLFTINFSLFTYSQVMFPGEELYYEVSFIGIKLGSIKVITEGKQSLNGYEIWKTKCYMDSYRGIPFVDLHSIYQSWIDPSVSFSRKFEGSTKKSDGTWEFQKIFFNRSDGNIKYEMWNNGNMFDNGTILSNKKMSDGLSLFFIARQYLKAGRSVKIPTFMEHDTSNTYINFSGKVENIEIDAISYPVRTVYFNGKADWTGVYGVTGQFEGWFSDDNARIPIQAKMKLYIGNADIHLIKWKRAGWTPPQ